MYGKNINIKPVIPSKDGPKHIEELFPLEAYDIICVGFSGGKDSIATTLHLLDLKVPREKILLLHHCIDGDGENEIINMDWNCTKDYCKKVADFLGIKIKFSWREKGFAGEILRIGASKPITFEQLDTSDIKTTFTDSWQQTSILLERMNEAIEYKDIEKASFYEEALKKLGYRFKFPAKTASLTTRWCSSALKIEVCDRIFRYSDLTQSNIKMLFIDGVRREESNNRAKYNEVEIHTTNAPTKHRIVHHWRAIIDWTESDVWKILKRYKINAHPCYHLGWSRCSCAACIFSMPCYLKGLKEINPNLFNSIEKLEKKLNFTMDNKKTITEYIDNAISCVPHNVDKFYINEANSNIITNNYLDKKWVLPQGAFSNNGGGPC